MKSYDFHLITFSLICHKLKKKTVWPEVLLSVYFCNLTKASFAFPQVSWPCCNGPLNSILLDVSCQVPPLMNNGKLRADKVSILWLKHQHLNVKVNIIAELVESSSSWHTGYRRGQRTLFSFYVPFSDNALLRHLFFEETYLSS